MEYKVMWRYKSGYGGPWEAGEVVELVEGLAEAINNDSPGVLRVLTTEITEKIKLSKKKGKDRMVKAGESREGFIMGREQAGYGKELMRGEE